MQIRKKLGVMALGAGLALTTIAGAALPALAADTTTTFTLTGGALTVSAPASANLGSFANDAASISAQLGAVTVSDLRGALGGSWSAGVTSTDFTTGAASADETILNDDIDYWSGTATASSGTAVRVPGQASSAVAASLAGPAAVTAYSASATVGNNVTTWNPTVVVTQGSDAVVGAYSGTVTHSVA